LVQVEKPQPDSLN